MRKRPALHRHHARSCRAVPQACERQRCHVYAFEQAATFHRCQAMRQPIGGKPAGTRRQRIDARAKALDGIAVGRIRSRIRGVFRPSPPWPGSSFIVNPAIATLVTRMLICTSRSRENTTRRRVTGGSAQRACWMTPPACTLARCRFEWHSATPMRRSQLCVALMATSNSPTYGQSNSPRQDGRIMSHSMG